jgi:hypothetical protein
LESLEIREARYRECVRAREEEQEKLQESDEKDLKAAAALYRKQQLERSVLNEKGAGDREGEEGCRKS